MNEHFRFRSFFHRLNKIFAIEIERKFGNPTYNAQALALERVQKVSQKVLLKPLEPFGLIIDMAHPDPKRTDSFGVLFNFNQSVYVNVLHSLL